MIVMKFGGTSVKDRDAILRVTEIVRGRMADKPLVVVSALSQVTRVLCNIAEVAETQCAEKAESLLAPLRERHLSLAAELLSADEKVLGQCLGDLNLRFAERFRTRSLLYRRTFSKKLCPYRLDRRAALFQDSFCGNERERTEMRLGGCP